MVSRTNSSGTYRREPGRPQLELILHRYYRYAKLGE
jgi:hypothetical protein